MIDHVCSTCSTYFTYHVPAPAYARVILSHWGSCQPEKGDCSYSEIVIWQTYRAWCITRAYTRTCALCKNEAKFALHSLQRPLFVVIGTKSAVALGFLRVSVFVTPFWFPWYSAGNEGVACSAFYSYICYHLVFAYFQVTVVTFAYVVVSSTYASIFAFCGWNHRWLHRCWTRFGSIFCALCRTSQTASLSQYVFCCAMLLHHVCF